MNRLFAVSSGKVGGRTGKYKVITIRSCCGLSEFWLLEEKNTASPTKFLESTIHDVVNLGISAIVVSSWYNLVGITLVN